MQQFGDLLHVTRSLLVCATLHTCSSGCVRDTIRHFEVLVAAVFACTVTPRSETPHASPRCHLAQAHSLSFCVGRSSNFVCVGGSRGWRTSAPTSPTAARLSSKVHCWVATSATCGHWTCVNHKLHLAKRLHVWTGFLYSGTSISNSVDKSVLQWKF